MRAFLFTLPNLAQDRHRARAKSSSRPVHPTAPTNSGPVGCPAVTGRRIGSIISLCSPKLSFLALWRLTVTFRCLHFVANAPALQTTTNRPHDSFGTWMEKRPLSRPYGMCRSPDRQAEPFLRASAARSKRSESSMGGHRLVLHPMPTSAVMRPSSGARGRPRSRSIEKCSVKIAHKVAISSVLCVLPQSLD